MSLLGRIIFFLLIIFIQWYFFQAIDTVTRFSSPLLKKITHNFYFVIVVFMILAALAAVIYPFQLWPRFIRISAGSLLLIVFLVQFLGILFLIPDDILRMFRWIYSRFLSSNEAIDAGEPISRYRFFSYLAVKIGRAHV